MPEFVKVASVSDLPPGKVTPIAVGDKMIALCNVGGTFYALDNVCLHRDGPLGEGYLDGEKLECPWHGWTYDVRTGQPDHPGGHSVSAYEVRVEGDDVLVGWLMRPSS